MKITDLQQMGAFVSSAPVKKNIKIRRPKPLPESEWSEPGSPEFSDEHEDASIDVFIRRGAAIDAIELMQAEKRKQPFVAIYRSVVNEDGSPLFESMEQVESIAVWLAMPLFEAITEVAGLRPKSSRRTTSGGSKPVSRSASRKRN